MKGRILSAGATLVLFLTSALAQHHMSNWVYKNASDTTIVPCWTDSMTAISIPPSSMGMMMPSSMYMRIDKMPMDSLTIAHDSTFMGWYRMQAGSDSMNFNMMNDNGMGGGSMMMQFAMSMACRFHWDSLMADSMHRHWHVTGMKGWNGSSWTMMTGVSLSSNVARFASTTAYSAIAFIGTSSVTAVERQTTQPKSFSLDQNYPNPFNPSTTIQYSVEVESRVHLDVFNILGQKMMTLVDRVESAGTHSVRLDASSLPSGIYFYRLQAGDNVQTRKMAFLK